VYPVAKKVPDENLRVCNSLSSLGRKSGPHLEQIRYPESQEGDDSGVDHSQPLEDPGVVTRVFSFSWISLIDGSSENSHRNSPGMGING
jgi:hypothetical protein